MSIHDQLIPITPKGFLGQKALGLFRPVLSFARIFHCLYPVAKLSSNYRMADAAKLKFLNLKKNDFYRLLYQLFLAKKKRPDKEEL